MFHSRSTTKAKKKKKLILTRWCNLSRSTLSFLIFMTTSNLLVLHTTAASANNDGLCELDDSGGFLSNKPPQKTSLIMVEYFYEIETNDNVTDDGITNMIDSIKVNIAKSLLPRLFDECLIRKKRRRSRRIINRRMSHKSNELTKPNNKDSSHYEEKENRGLKNETINEFGMTENVFENVLGLDIIPADVVNTNGCVQVVEDGKLCTRVDGMLHLLSTSADNAINNLVVKKVTAILNNMNGILFVSNDIVKIWWGNSASPQSLADDDSGLHWRSIVAAILVVGIVVMVAIRIASRENRKRKILIPSKDDEEYNMDFNPNDKDFENFKDEDL